MDPVMINVHGDVPLQMFTRFPKDDRHVGANEKNNSTPDVDEGDQEGGWTLICRKKRLIPIKTRQTLPREKKARRKEKTAEKILHA
ncbi:hypothetical protein LIER_24836 [Lithospermum erythrorhizon]|uniref:Uncharacterized protein n=1 Tax=Lithospermum erythrorhizon TaxID=34254 RepID=A0AAV3R6K3_LITER